MEMKFTKYEKHGAYHWKQYETSERHRNYANLIKEWVQEKIVLDVGAGDGLLTSLLGIIGIDNEPTAVKLAQEKGANVFLGSAYSINFGNEQFESVMMIDTLEHLEKPELALQEARRVLRKFLYITTPPKDLVPGKMDHFHVQEWTPEGLKELVEGEGFQLEGEIVVVPGAKAMLGKFRKI